MRAFDPWTKSGSASQHDSPPCPDLRHDCAPPLNWCWATVRHYRIDALWWGFVLRQESIQPAGPRLETGFFSSRHSTPWGVSTRLPGHRPANRNVMLCPREISGPTIFINSDTRPVSEKTGVFHEVDC